MMAPGRNPEIQCIRAGCWSTACEARTVAVMRVLEAAKEPLSIADIARHFAQGRQIEKRAGLVVAALARLGHLASADGGKTVSLRAAA